MLEVGSQCPKFEGCDESGTLWTLEKIKTPYLLIYFYPRDMTPGCTQESCDLRDSYEELESLGVTVLGVSKDSQDKHQKFIKKYSLPFPLIADVEGEMCQSFGVWQEKKMYGKSSMGIVRSTFLLSKKGEVLKTWPKVKVKGHVEDIIDSLKALG